MKRARRWSAREDLRDESDVRRLEATQRRRAAAVSLVLWMAKEYAEAGGSNGPEMRTYRDACAELGVEP